MIGIRVDGNAKIGTGHIMRCLSIAHALKSVGHTPVFITADENEIIEKQGFECLLINGAYDDLTNEQIGELLVGRGITTLLVDSYFADAAYFERLPAGITTAYIFDFGDANLPVDLMINYNISFDKFKYPQKSKTLLGCSYVPLREEFLSPQPARQFKRARSVLITTGGTDPHNITCDIIHTLTNDPLFQTIELDVVIGRLNAHAAKVKELMHTKNNVICFENVAKMSRLMQKCDIAISAGGSTLYEICASALPCVTFSFVDNQDEMVASMHESGTMLLAGNYLADKKSCLENILIHTKKLVEDNELRRYYSEKAYALVDGMGAQRIANELIALSK